MKMKKTGYGSMKMGLLVNGSVHPVGEDFGFLHFPFSGGRFAASLLSLRVSPTSCHRIHCGFKASK